MKRIFLIVFTVIVAISVISGACVPASALGRFDTEWGSEKDGVVMPAGYRNNLPGYYENCPGTSGFPNGDFEQGLKYWASNYNGKPSDTVDVIEENGNKFIRFSATETFEGIESLRFVDSRVKVGDRIAIMYDWRADDPSFQVVLKQYLAEPNTISVKRLSMRAGVNVVEAYTDQEWNTTVTEVKTNEFDTSAVLEPENETKTIYLTFLLELMSNPTLTVDIDNVRLVRYNKTTGKITDLDGKLLYDVNNLEKEVTEENLTEEDFAGIDYNADFFSEKSENGTTDSGGKNENEKSFIENYLWVIIAGCVIIIIAAVAVVIIVVKKKKVSVPSEEVSSEDAPEVQPPTEE